MYHQSQAHPGGLCSAPGTLCLSGPPDLYARAQWSSWGFPSPLSCLHPLFPGTRGFPFLDEFSCFCGAHLSVTSRVRAHGRHHFEALPVYAFLYSVLHIWLFIWSRILGWEPLYFRTLNTWFYFCCSYCRWREVWGYSYPWSREWAWFLLSGSL